MCVRVLGAALALCLLAPVGAASAQAADSTVEMQIITFSVVEAHVPAGGSVLWANTSTLAHTVTADDGTFDSGSLDPGATFSMTFDTPGSYQYYCQPHGSAGLHGMSGTIIVDDA
jgi:plastocyanin